MGGFAYQIAYAVARLASLATGRPVLDLDDIPTAMRFDWAEDLDERLQDGRVVFTQCKRVADAARPANIADVMIGLAPKLLWSSGHQDDIRFRLVSPDPRFGRVATAAKELPRSERKEVLDAVSDRLRRPPTRGSDRGLWQDAAVALGIDTLAELLWERLEFVHVRDDVMSFDPAGPLFPPEREAVNLLLSAQHTHPARQTDTLHALRGVLHGSVVGFDPASEAPTDLPVRAPRVVERWDLTGALLPYRAEYAGVLPFRVVNRLFLDAEMQYARRPFVARFPEWRDVVHGDDETLRFVERDATTGLCERVRTMVAEARDSRDGIPALFVVGAPGTGKSTLVRRVAAILALEGCCTVADPGAYLDPIDKDESDAIVHAIDALAASGRPVLLVLDDPLFANSSWPALLRRLRDVGPTVVLGATPSLLYDQFAHQLPQAIVGNTYEMGPPSERERRQLASHHGRAFDERSDAEEELIVLAMEASAGQPFHRIIDGIWRTLNGGEAIDPRTPPHALPWLVRVFLVVCFYHRYYVAPRERLLREALDAEGSPRADELAHTLGRLVSTQGWNIFRVAQADARVAWAGPAISTIHARVARAAWQRRPAPGFDVTEWILPATVTKPGGAWETGQLLATMLGDDRETAERCFTRLDSAWHDAVVSGAGEVRNLTLFTGSGKVIDRRFPTFERTLRAAAAMGGSQAWLAAYALYLNSADEGSNRSYPDDIPLVEVIDDADFSVAELRAVKFAQSLPAQAMERFRVRVWSLIEDWGGNSLSPGLLPVWLVRREPIERVDEHVPALVALAGETRRGWGLLSSLMTRLDELSADHVAAVVAATNTALTLASGDFSAHTLANAARSAIRPGQALPGVELADLYATLASWKATTPHLKPHEAPTLAPMRARERILGDVQMRLVNTTPAEIAAWLTAHDGITRERRRAVCDLLRDECRATNDARLAAVAFYLMWPDYGESEGLACTIADLAFMAHLDDAPDAAKDILTPFQRGHHPSVMGRLAALSAISGGPEAAIAALMAVPARQRGMALVGLFRLLGPAPRTEAHAWHELGTVTPPRARPSLRRLLLIVASSRVLAIERGLDEETSRREDLVSWMLAGLDDGEVVRVLEGALFAWARNPREMEPRILPYQVVSIYETLITWGRKNPLLENRLSATLRSVLADADADAVERFTAWKPYSPVVRRALAAV
jgi:hypothetical protein